MEATDFEVIPPEKTESTQEEVEADIAGDVGESEPHPE